MYGRHLLLPFAESLFFLLDLLCECFSQCFFLLSVPSPERSLRFRFSKLAVCHLLLSIIFIVYFFGRRDQVEHVRAYQEVSQLLKVAMLLVFDLCDAPRIRASNDCAAIWRLYRLGGADDSKRHGCHDILVVVRHGLVLAVYRAGVHTDMLCFNHFQNLYRFAS